MLTQRPIIFRHVICLRITLIVQSNIRFISWVSRWQVLRGTVLICLLSYNYPCGESRIQISLCTFDLISQVLGQFKIIFIGHVECLDYLVAGSAILRILTVE